MGSGYNQSKEGFHEIVKIFFFFFQLNIRNTQKISLGGIYCKNNNKTMNSLRQA